MLCKRIIILLLLCLSFSLRNQYCQSHLALNLSPYPSISLALTLFIEVGYSGAAARTHRVGEDVEEEKNWERDVLRKKKGKNKSAILQHNVVMTSRKAHIFFSKLGFAILGL